MMIELELTSYICMYMNWNGNIDCVLCGDFNTAYEIYNRYQKATIIEIDCTKNTRTIIEQK